MIARKFLVLGTVLAALSTSTVMGSAARAQEVPPNDMLLATLWTQRSVEYRGNALTVFALAKIRLDQALNGLSVPLHPGAARFYREQGLPVDNAPQAAAEGNEEKRP